MSEINTTVSLHQFRDTVCVPLLSALGLQHVLAMFVSNVTPAIIIAGAAGFGSSDMSAMIYMIQMSMVFAGIGTLLQTTGAGPFGAKLPGMVAAAGVNFLSSVIWTRRNMMIFANSFVLSGWGWGWGWRLIHSNMCR